MTRALETWIKNALAEPGVLPSWTAADVASLRDQVEAVADRAFAGDREALEDLHRAAYRAFVARYTVPWQSPAVDSANPLLATLLWTFCERWVTDVRGRHAALLTAAPVDVDAYVDWVVTIVQQHRSNVTHPLFDFLAGEATPEQLREFLFQETPFDIFFADIMCSLLPGVYGEPKVEIAGNFWDEMGNGDAARNHRQLRLSMMEYLEMPRNAHVTNVDAFVLEQIELANAYFIATFDRSRAAVLLGMLLATESMVPGRLERQIEGWRRVGVADRDMEYLLEHTVVDVAHANGWIDHVIRPVLREDPTTLRAMTLGVAMRLDIAARVCDRMLEHLKALPAPVAARVPAGLEAELAMS